MYVRNSEENHWDLSEQAEWRQSQVSIQHDEQSEAMSFVVKLKGITIVTLVSFPYVTTCEYLMRGLFNSRICVDSVDMWHVREWTTMTIVFAGTIEHRIPLKKLESPLTPYPGIIVIRRYMYFGIPLWWYNSTISGLVSCTLVFTWNIVTQVSHHWDENRQSFLATDRDE